MLCRLAITFLAALALSLVGAGVASASPDVLRILLVDTSQNGSDFELQESIEEQPEVAEVDRIEFPAEALPDAAALSGYDIVVSGGNNGVGSLAEAQAYGDALASYLKGGGALFQFAYESWDGDEDEEEAYGPRGAFQAEGFPPYLPGDNVNVASSLDTSTSANPLFAGVGELTAAGNTAPSLAPGATSLAQWDTGHEAIAAKGPVLATSAYLDGGEWSGDYGRLIVNAAQQLPRLTPAPPLPPPPAPTLPTLAVANSNPAGGTVTSSLGGISCGALCSAKLPIGSAVTLAAAPAKGFAFGGYSGACTGSACSLTLDADKSVGASFVGFAPVKKIALNRKKGTGTLKVTLGSAGSLVLSGKKLNKQSKVDKVAGTVKIPLVAKGAAKRALATKGKAKVSYELIFTPTGGAAAAVKGSVTLHQKLAG